ncbi:ATP-dependent RNA helicase DBP4 [Kwoniella pini CBS 10737]|uniref:ATP-dependent RNA helicase n=1 Tax=Kwoniella pini CBS 10737 TaxID=1296096 RepID=A0A1B9HUB4_9TREE|nr:ATP-dependent RNA helicase DBP4 [Kwoniella pini CBS 10737]OCF46853.1 ATP-dependent RNA helicase DBP4 [Kwoniella pini CBS 10737]
MAFVDNKASSSKSAQGSKGKGGKGKPAQPRLKSNQAKRLRIDEELKELQAKVDSWVPPAEITVFNELPLSARTLKGLKSSHFLNPTPIQQLAIPPALRGQDLLGSAKTGSGKTLAFLIPMLERLYLDKWGPMDGLGAVVISPTRELAVQTFNQLRDIGKYHNFSAGLVIGGKPLKEEQERLGRMNILIATPGRLLQHLDSTVGFESSGVKVLVLDEADRLLDLGFLPALRAIIGHFSSGTQLSNTKPNRQTLLFSATQTKDLASLAKLSLYQPEYINCNKAGEEGVVPSNLEQFYAVVGLEKKLDTLWGFVKSHLKMKGIVFVTSGKQVRFIFETFRRLHPGLPLMHLHGKQKQPTRLSIFQKYSTSKHALLICTDVAARGLDFPAVDWVIQLDCPDDVDTYIHRIGRTARYQAGGHALTLLCPSEEEGMLNRWKEKMIEVKKIKIKESKMGNLKQQMQNFAFREPEIKYLGQRAFISYMKSVHIQKDKSIFKFSDLPAEAFAESMGLPGAPQIKFAEQKAAKVRGGAKKDMPQEEEEAKAIEEVEERAVVGSDEESDDEDDEVEVDEEESEDEEEAEETEAENSHKSEASESDSESSSVEKPKSAPAVRTKYDRMFERKNQSILTPHYTALISHKDGEDDDEEEEENDDVFTLARRDHALSGDEISDNDNDNSDIEELSKVIKGKSKIQIEEPLISLEDLSKRKLKSLSSKKNKFKNGPLGEKLIFDEKTGESRNFYETGKEFENTFANEEKRKEFLEIQREKMKLANEIDKAIAKEKKIELKRKRKEREKEARQEFISDDEGGDGPVAYLGGVEYSDEERSLINSPEPEPEVRNKKKRKNKFKSNDDSDNELVGGALEDDEALALKLLQGS